MGEALRIGAPPIDVRLRRHPRARRLTLRLRQPEGAPVLTLPPGTSRRAALRFLTENEPWLRARLSEMPPRAPVRPGLLLPVLGRARRVVMGARAGLDGDSLHVPGPCPAVARQVRAVLRETARARLSERVCRHAAALGTSAARISLRDTRSRWGSCTARGHLMFSWRLAMAPEAVLDYVAAHECAHLREMNHSARFWAHVADLCPDYRAHRVWLRVHGAALHRFDFGEPAS